MIPDGLSGKALNDWKHYADVMADMQESSDRHGTQRSQSGEGFRRKRMGRGTTMHHPADTLFIHYDENGFMHPIRKDGTWSNIPGEI